MPASKINGLKTGTFYEEFSEYLEKLSCASGKVIILGDFNINFLDTSGFAYKRIFLKLLIVYNILTSQHTTVVIYLILSSQGRTALVCQICMYLTLSVITELYMYH